MWYTWVLEALLLAFSGYVRITARFPWGRRAGKTLSDAVDILRIFVLVGLFGLPADWLWQRVQWAWHWPWPINIAVTLLTTALPVVLVELTLKWVSMRYRHTHPRTQADPRAD